MKKKYLLDTSIIAFLFRKAYNIGNKLRELESDQCFVSEITIAELTYLPPPRLAHVRYISQL